MGPLNLTRIVSLPMRSISHQGMIIRFFDEREAKIPSPGKTIAVISPLAVLNSKSEIHPSKRPSHRLITSLLRSSENDDKGNIKGVCI